MKKISFLKEKAHHEFHGIDLETLIKESLHFLGDQI